MMVKEPTKPKREKTRFEMIAEEPPIGMLPNGKLNIVGFDEDYAPGGLKDPSKN